MGRQQMTRFEDWPNRLDKFIEENRHRKFERGEFDCALFAGLALEAMTGEEFVKPYFRGYKTKKQAFDMLRAGGMDSLIEVANKYLGGSLESVNFASRGDIVAVKYENEVALAVVDLTGRYAVTTGKDGLFFFDRKYWLKAWGV